MTDRDPVSWYDTHGDGIAGDYEVLPADQVHAWLNDLLPIAPALVLDIGAGTGRDAAMLAAKGYEVVAIEPSETMRRHGQILHHDERIRWVHDRLPALTMTWRLGLAADVVLLSAVWQHVAPADRRRAFLVRCGCCLYRKPQSDHPGSNHDLRN